MPVASVGDTAGATKTITRTDIEAYADLVGDTNPIHVDDDYAEATMFDGRVAHGMLSAGVVSAALADLAGDVVYLSQDLQFEAPVHPGDTVTATADVVEDVGNDQLRVQTTVVTGDDTDEPTTVLSGDAIVMSVPHDPQPAEPESTGSESEPADSESEPEAETCDD
ncbi:MaoC family dehydratase [Halorubellus sp. JP-L1]|uniref:MaoC family dehydratase n=1 Tax=Halorubellus sp. JP-L1 TaxID=2715753 RepID=UPI00140D526E|nr:MaoC family dehydratase [Halorubellus sp. JP-L1]NHN43422.1 MaoC family dehydratase [Halorubellus sp. JP-L1]